jgi:pyruvate,water dikinase
MYSWYHLFQKTRQRADRQLFWFQDSVHAPEVLFPYDEVVAECWWHPFATRVFAVPEAVGVDQRILNGYLYLSFVPPPEPCIETTEECARRIAPYYDDWDESYEMWKKRVLSVVDKIRSLTFEPLPIIDPNGTSIRQTGISSGHVLIQNFEQLILLLRSAYQYHFELLTVSQTTVSAFFRLCQGACPDVNMSDLVKVIEADDLELFRPDRELRRLARMAKDSGIQDQILQSQGPEDLFPRLNSSQAGRAWLHYWNATAEPWFWFSTNPGHPGMSHLYGTWADDPAVPLKILKEYLSAQIRGQSLDAKRPEILRIRQETADNLRRRMATNNLSTFDQLLRLAQKASCFIDDHTLYVEHWVSAAFWSKSKELARALTAMDALDSPEDMFFLRKDEVSQTIADSIARWSVANGAGCKEYWRPIVERRRRIYNALKSHSPMPVLGKFPHQKHAALELRWGITEQAVNAWRDSRSGSDSYQPVLHGIGASPGVGEGAVRVIFGPLEGQTVDSGTVLVCRSASPTWTHAFARAAAVVSDSGGVLCHAAVVCREYDIPAVMGVGSATATLQDGQRVRVDGSAGVVTVLEPDLGGGQETRSPGSGGES